MSDPAGGSAPAPGADVDWEVAARLAGRLAHPGPAAPRADREQLVAELRDAAQRAVPIAVRASRLATALSAAGQDPTAPRPARVLVVDRPGWARIAGRSFAALAQPPDAATTPTSRASTLQAGALLGLLAGRVVGQYDPFSALTADAPVQDPGTLLLVAPTVLQVERALSADPSDFRLWVCVHEQTHALQFAAAPWLAQHLADGVRTLVTDLADTSPWQDARGLLEQGRAALTRRQRGDGADDDRDGARAPVERLLGPAQREQLDRITAVMSVLEGHADVAMDAVPRHVLPSRRRLRARMDARRRRTNGAVDRLLRQVLGMEAKLAQYRNGAVFVRGVRRYGGRHALDPLWAGPDGLPDLRELTDARAWVRRVHG